MPTQTRPGTASVLLIEDEPTVARLTELVLTNAGYQVDVQADHSAAPERIAEHQYDLVIADTDLGARTAGLKGLVPLVEAAGSRPVLLFSAHRFSAAEIAAAGLAGAIRKPYDIDELLRLVADTLQSEGGIRPRAT